MPYVIPAMPIECKIYTQAPPPVGPPRVTTMCQLRYPGKLSTGQDSALSGWPFLWAILLPPLTDIRDTHSPSGADLVECPSGSNRFYVVRHVDDVAKGFPNEYRIAMVGKIGPWPEPIP